MGALIITSSWSIGPVFEVHMVVRCWVILQTRDGEADTRGEVMWCLRRHGNSRSMFLGQYTRYLCKAHESVTGVDSRWIRQRRRWERRAQTYVRVGLCYFWAPSMKNLNEWSKWPNWHPRTAGANQENQYFDFQIQIFLLPIFPEGTDIVVWNRTFGVYTISTSTIVLVSCWDISRVFPDDFILCVSWSWQRDLVTSWHLSPLNHAFYY